MIDTATFLGYIFLSYFIAYMIGFIINGVFSFFNIVR